MEISKRGLANTVLVILINCIVVVLCTHEYDPNVREGKAIKLSVSHDESNYKCYKDREFYNAKKKRGYVAIEMTAWDLFSSTFGISSAVACEEICRKTCRCTGYFLQPWTWARPNTTACVLFKFTTPHIVEIPSSTDIFYILTPHENINVTSPASPPTHLPSSVPRADGRNKSRRGLQWWMWVLGAALPAIAISFVASFCYLWTKQDESLKDEEFGEVDLVLSSGNQIIRSPDKMNSKQHKKIGCEMQMFRFKFISAATNQFSSANKLGEGGFGPVYKGNLHGEQQVAVKRLSRSSSQGMIEFKNEIELIAKLQHTNLVRLLGCCTERSEKMLVYEFLANKSLDSFLFDPTKKTLLDWKKRLEIIEGTAQGLLYLHKYSRLKVIHRDLKTSNILLDSEFKPKISDFGLARMFEKNKSIANTKRIVGTFGYMSPEYAMGGLYSEKSDVFSFGVIVLEIMSGKRATSFTGMEHPPNLIRYAWDLWRKGRAIEVIDKTIGESETCTSVEQLVRHIQVGLLCVEESPSERPKMSDVLAMLTNGSLPLQAPNRPAFFYCGTRKKDAALDEHDDAYNCSPNLVTLSPMEGR